LSARLPDEEWTSEKELMRFVSVLRHTVVVIAASGLAAGMAEYAAAQNPAPASAARAPKPSTPKHSKKHAAKPSPQVVAPVVETRPPDPPPPDWPANAKAQNASVGWNGRDLSIAASNSSLKQILHDVSTATGLKVDGIGNDQKADARVYGSYGPASARDVLSQLLEGSGYNVLMIGDQGEGTPRELLLTAKSAHNSATKGQQGGIQAQQNQNQEDEVQEEPEQPEPPPPPTLNRPVGNPQQPDQGRTPQQLLQDLQQQRIQQLQQQQQQQQSGQPPAYNPNPTPPPTPAPN
jgi:hypothetical protein